MSKCWIPPNKKRIRKKEQVPITLSLLKTANVSFYSFPDQSIVYTYTVTNTSTVPIVGPIVINDNRLGMKIINGGLLSNASVSTTMTYNVTLQDVTNRITIVNTAVATEGSSGTASNVSVVVLPCVPF